MFTTIALAPRAPRVGNTYHEREKPLAQRGARSMGSPAAQTKPNRKRKTMLREGLLWFDDDTRRSVAVRVRNAIERYEERFGIRPNFCYLNPDQATNLQIPGLALVGEASLGRNYFLLGHDTNQEVSAPAPPLTPLRRQRPARTTHPVRGRRASA